MITGIISGMGAFAGANLLTEINRLTATAKGRGVSDADFPEVVLHQIPFTTSTHLGAVDCDTFRGDITRSVTAMRAFAVDRMMFACNSHDRTARKIISEVGGMNYISIRSVLRETLLGHPGEKFLFLGSEHLVREMDLDSFPGKSFTLPDQRDVNYLIQKGIEGRTDTTVFESVIAAHPDRIPVLGCTELHPYHQHNSIETIDSIYALAERITS